MMRAPLLFSLLAAVVCLTTAPPARADAGATFAAANSAYAAGHFAEAIKGYEALVEGQHWSANVFYDLGNAYFRAGDPGRAILNYERALALNPAQPEAQANLRLVRDQARALELAPSWPETHLDFLTANQFAILAAVALWGAAFLLAAILFSRSRPVAWIFGFVLLLAIGGGSVFAVTAFETGKNGGDLAIVTAAKVQARLATAENAGTVLVLPPGSEIRVLSTRGQWSYAALPNDLRGWIPAKSAERVRL